MGYKGICEIPGCKNTRITHNNLCLMHYRENLRYSTPSPHPRRLPRFWESWPIIQIDIYIESIKNPEYIKYLMMRSKKSIVKELCETRLKELCVKVPKNKELKCMIKGCKGIPNAFGHYAKGFCQRHYQQHRNGVIDEDGKTIRKLVPRNKRKVQKCKIEECNESTNHKGFCHRHYIQYLKKKRDIHGNKLEDFIEHDEASVSLRDFNKLIREIDMVRQKIKSFRDRVFSQDNVRPGLINHISFLDDNLHFIYSPNFILNSVDFLENLTLRKLLDGEKDEPVSIRLELTNDLKEK